MLLSKSEILLRINSFTVVLNKQGCLFLFISQNVSSENIFMILMFYNAMQDTESLSCCKIRIGILSNIRSILSKEISWFCWNLMKIEYTIAVKITSENFSYHLFELSQNK